MKNTARTAPDPEFVAIMRENPLHVFVYRAGQAVDAGKRQWADVARIYGEAIPGIVLDEVPAAGGALVALLTAYSTATTAIAILHTERCFGAVIGGCSAEERAYIGKAWIQEGLEAETAFSFACARRLMEMGESVEDAVADAPARRARRSSR
jgi:hypothetical protein